MHLYLIHLLSTHDSSELQWNSMEHYWAQHYYQRVFILTEKGRKGSEHPKKSFGCPSRRLENCSWRVCLNLLHESLFEFHTKQWLLTSLTSFLLVTPYFHFCLHVSIKFSQQNTKKWHVAQDFYTYSSSDQKYNSRCCLFERTFKKQLLKAALLL